MADTPPMPQSQPQTAGRRRYVPVVGPRLKRLLTVVFTLFALMTINSVYLVSVTLAGVEYQGWFYLNMFVLHLTLGLVIIVPAVVFGLAHMRNAHGRRNRRAIRVGYALFGATIVLLISGLVLMRVDLFGVRFELNHPVGRSTSYWVHVIAPLVAIWLFLLHRLAGRRIKWKVGLAWTGVAVVFAVGMLVLHTQDPRAWNVAGPESGERYFFPSLSRTSTGNFIPAEVLSNDEYCRECHTDIHDSWSHSVHKFSSFNNPPYEFSVRETRRAMMKRDGNVQGSRFCAGCHDPVPFFSGAFDDPRFDDPDYDLSQDEMAQAGITCTVCHSIVHINSPRGNADFTIDEPVHYPFALHDNSILRWLNRQLVKAKPEFHRATFLKPLHRSTEFCGTCHKVHLPPELNDYKWLRGQNHYDAFWLSGVSGHGITSFYYPARAEPNCNGCHMSLVEASDAPNFGARARDDSGLVKTLDHQFPSANTAIPHLLRDVMPRADAAIDAHRRFNDGVVRLDIFGVREGGGIDDPLSGPLRPEVPVLQPGRSYLLEVVVRTVKMGHLFTQGTVDSNQVWIEIVARSGDRKIGHSGARTPPDNTVDPWSHFVNAFVIDRDGNRINRRNAEDIFVSLYDHQIPPGAADVVHYRLDVPDDVQEPVVIEATLLYRKFDTEYMRLVTGDDAYRNDLPVLTLAEDRVAFPVSTTQRLTFDQESTIEPWQRWNDYGIGLLRKGQFGELRQAAQAFARVEQLGRPEGPLNLARVYIKEGLVQSHAPDALRRAAVADPSAPPWSLLWFGAVVAEANGDYDQAISNLRDLVRGGFPLAEGRGFDFEKDYRVLNALGQALYQRGLQSFGDERDRLVQESRDWFVRTLELDPENLAAHWGLKQVYQLLGNVEREREHAALHARYKPDDNARDDAVARARLNYPAANRATEAVVIYELNRSGGGADPVHAARLEKD